MFGVTVFVSDEMPAGTEMILVDADQLAVDPGRVELASTTQADLRLDSETSDGPGQMVSLWRTNMVGVRAERVFGFKLTRGLGGVGHCLEPEHLNMTVLESFQDLPASLSESNLLLPSRQIRNTSLMEKQLAQIMLDREFKYVGTWEAEQQYRTTVVGALVFTCLLAVPHAAARGDEVAALAPVLQALRRASRADRRPSAWSQSRKLR
jgi:hypothetical protein